MSTISATTLRHLLMCERRVWLDYHEETPPADVLTMSAAGVRHEDDISAAMFGPAQPVPVATWQDSVRLTAALMREGTDAIRGAAFEAPVPGVPGWTLRGRMDWLKRVRGVSRVGRWSYEPVEIKLRRELVEEDRLQLDLYLWLLRQAQDVEVSGWFWLGQDPYGGPQQVIEHVYREDRLMPAIERTVDLLDQTTAPPVFLASHCGGCRWHGACRAAAVEEGHVTLLPGLSRLTWDAMQRAGVRRMDDVLALPLAELRRFKGVGSAKAADLHAYARAFADNVPVMRDRLPDEARRPGLMLDLETSIQGEPGLPWCFGWQAPGGPYRVMIVDPHYDGGPLHLPGLGVEILADGDEGWRRIAAAAEAIGGPVYHWGSFELGILRKTAPPELVDALAPRFHDLNRTFRKTVALPVEGTSIKTVGPYLGYHWPAGASAFTAWEDYNTWLRYADREALARACAYNRADVEAMALVWQWMNQTAG